MKKIKHAFWHVIAILFATNIMDSGCSEFEWRRYCAFMRRHGCEP